jgi:hypothetical protein
MEKFAKKVKRAIYVENILTQEFADFFVRRGYREDKANEPMCFYLPR